MKKILLVSFALVAFGQIVVAQNYDFSDVAPNGQTLYYKIRSTGNDVYLVAPGDRWGGYEKPSGNLVIPSSVTYNGVGYPVVSIGTEAFYGCSEITSVTIPNSITSIGQSSFSSCNGLTSITIPNSITSIGIAAFGYCTGLNSVEFNANNCTTDIGGGPFVDCNNITAFTFGNNVSSIPDKLCSHLGGLTTMIIPNTITKIGYSAFSYCSALSSLSIPNSVTEIGSSAFSYCNSLTSVSVPNSVTELGTRAFQNCSGLTSATIGSSIEQMEGTFRGCTHLTTIISKAEMPPICDDETFQDVPNYADIIVPCNAAYRYEATDYWKDFSRITEDCGGTDGINDVDGNKVQIYTEGGNIMVNGIGNEKVQVFDMVGRPVGTQSLPTGVYMVKVGTLPARKVVVIR